MYKVSKFFYFAYLFAAIPTAYHLSSRKNSHEQVFDPKTPAATRAMRNPLLKKCKTASKTRLNELSDLLSLPIMVNIALKPLPVFTSRPQKRKIFV